MKPIILASASPRRRELLMQIGVAFTVVTADIDETPIPGENHVKYTVRLAEAKALAVLVNHPEAIVIGADTIVTIDGHLLGKPHNTADAERMLQLLQGRTHQVTTGIAVLTSEATHIGAETTDVTFAPMDTATIRAYIATNEPMDKAGAYAIQGIAAQWIPRIEGDYSNVVGLPLARLTAMLRGPY
jgi:septum formation protein